MVSDECNSRQWERSLNRFMRRGRGKVRVMAQVMCFHLLFVTVAATAGQLKKEPSSCFLTVSINFFHVRAAVAKGEQKWKRTAP